MWLLFQGLSKEEVIALTSKDITGDKIKLADRDIIMYPETHRAVDGAIHQHKYNYANGKPMGATYVREISKSDYIIRPLGNKHGEPITYGSLRKRIGDIKQIYGENPYLNIRGLYYSGLLHELRKVEIEKGLIPDCDFDRICKIYNAQEGYKVKERYKGYDVQYPLKSKN
jgi:hypothetical protein